MFFSSHQSHHDLENKTNVVTVHSTSMFANLKYHILCMYLIEIMLLVPGIYFVFCVLFIIQLNCLFYIHLNTFIFIANSHRILHKVKNFFREHRSQTDEMLCIVNRWQQIAQLKLMSLTVKEEIPLAPHTLYRSFLCLL